MGRVGLGGVRAGEVAHGAAGAAGQTPLDQTDRQQGDDEHPDQQGEMPFTDIRTRRPPLGRDSYLGNIG
jgi:hypothetical protein